MRRGCADDRALPAADLLALGLSGVRGRPLRAALSGLGIAIGIACVVAVLGVLASSQAGLLNEIDRLGTNLLTVHPGENLVGGGAILPPEAAAMISHLPGVQHVAETSKVTGAVYRNDHVPTLSTGGISILAVSPAPPETLGVAVAAGRWFNAATEQFPTTVLGAAAARRLGATHPGEHCYLGPDHRFGGAGRLSRSRTLPRLWRLADHDLRTVHRRGRARTGAQAGTGRQPRPTPAR